MSLLDVYNKFPNEENSDKGYYHGYMPLYNKLLNNYINCEVFCEIGVAKGFSLRIWDQFFSEKTKIFGIDINLKYIDPVIKNEFSSRINLVESDILNLNNTYIKNLNFDIVIDDGSHQLDHQIETIEFFITKMNVGGMIIIEDVQSQTNLNILSNKYRGYSLNIQTETIPDDRLFIILC